MWKKKNSNGFLFLSLSFKIKNTSPSFLLFKNCLIALGQQHKNYGVGQNMGNILIKSGVSFVFSFIKKCWAKKSQFPSAPLFI